MAPSSAFVLSRTTRAAAAAPAASPHPLCRALAQAFAGSLLSLLLPGQAHANPQGHTVMRGHAIFDRAGKRLTVTNSPGTVIDWESFSIKRGETTHFQQRDAASTVLNRVTSRTPSKLFGTLTSNGQVILVNPAGIAVGRDAMVDTAGFTASTLSITDADGAAGRLRFQDGGGAKAVQVDGSIRSRNGDVVLLAPKVEVGAPAAVRAENGTVILAAGQAAALTGRGLEGIHFELKPAGEARNLGRLEGDAVAVFAGTLRHSGTITARTARQQGGKVVLLAGDVALEQRGRIDASGALGGGTVLVGGARAVDGVDNARDVRLASGTVVRADALDRGDGGRVVVWGERTADVQGGISARGGTRGGNGGSVETSTGGRLDVSGAVSVAAPRAQGGRWRIAGRNVQIGAERGGGRDARSREDGSIGIASLEGVLDEGSEVEVDGRDIRLNEPLQKTSSALSTLILQATRNVVIQQPITSTTGQLDLALNADSDGDGKGITQLKAGIDTHGGRMTLASGTADWYGGTTWRNGTTTLGPDATLNLVGGGKHGLWNYTLENRGAVNYKDSGGLFANAGSVLRNRAGGVFAFQVDGRIGSDGTTTSRFENQGTIRRTAEGPGTSEIGGDALLYEGSNETIDAGSGRIDFTSPMACHTHAGRIHLLGDVGFSAGLHVFESGATLAGTLNLRGADARFGNVTLGQETNLRSGNIDIDEGRTLTLPDGGVLNWSGGTRIAGGTLSVAPGATLNIDGTDLHAFRSHTLDNAGQVNFDSSGSAPLVIDGATTIHNLPTGTFAFRSDGIISGNSSCSPCTFRNDGLLLKTGDLGPMTIRVDYTQGSSGRLRVRIGSAAQFDWLDVSGTAALDGTLEAARTGTATIPAGATFGVIAAGGGLSASGLTVVVPGDEWSSTQQANALQLAPAGGSVPPPPPPPTPAPTPAPSAQDDRIQDILDGQATVSDVRQGVAELEATVTQPVVPVAKETAPKKKRKGDAPADNGQQCLP